MLRVILAVKKTLSFAKLDNPERESYECGEKHPSAADSFPLSRRD